MDYYKYFRETKLRPCGMPKLRSWKRVLADLVMPVDGRHRGRALTCADPQAVMPP